MTCLSLPDIVLNKINQSGHKEAREQILGSSETDKTMVVRNQNSVDRERLGNPQCDENTKNFI